MRSYTDAERKKAEEYSKEIVTIDNFMEAVRKTLGQYISYTGTKGWINACREVIQNILDEMNDINSFCDMGWISFDERTQQIICRDNGRGIPLKDIERVYASQHTSKNYEKAKGNYTSGSHGVGAKVTNAVSSEFIVESHVFGETRKVIFHNGDLYKDTGIKKDKEKLQGTIVTAIPHPCMENPQVKCEDLLNLLESIVPLYKIGTRIYFEGTHMDGTVIKREIVNQDGLLTYLIRQTTDPLITPIVMSGDTGDVKAEIALTYDATDLSGMCIVESYANYCPTLMGTHVDGFLNGLCNFFRNYMNKIYLGTAEKDNKKKKKITIVNNDIKTGLRAVVHGLCLYPTFMGQAKEGISNKEIKEYLEKQVPIWLDEWSKKAPKDFLELCKYFKKCAELRMTQDKERAKIVESYKKNRLTDMPDKFLDNNDHNSPEQEIIIVEGDSAFGSYKNTRNANTQALYPVRGKFINVFANSENKIYANQEFQELDKIIGGGLGNNFDITKVRWKRIMFGVDADIDGHHIRTLLAKYIIKYKPGLIESGRVYITVPPLYGVKQSNGKMRYFVDKLDFIKWVEKDFIKKIPISRYEGSAINQSDLIKILYDNEEYAREMDKIAYATNPHFLEYVLRIRNRPIKELAKLIKTRYKFLEYVRVEGNTTVIRCLVDQKINTVFLNDRFLDQCSKIIPYIDKNYTRFVVNGQVTGLYGLMKAFDNFSPVVVRYKGLGEMNEEQLAESTLYPNPNRLLVRYTISNFANDLEQIKYLESNKQELLSSFESDD